MTAECAVADGTLTAVFSSVRATPLLSFSAKVTMAQLSQQATNGRHSLALSGSAFMDYAEQSTSVARFDLRADGAVMATVRTHQFSDTVALQSGDGAAGQSRAATNPALARAARPAP